MLILQYFTTCGTKRGTPLNMRSPMLLIHGQKGQHCLSLPGCLRAAALSSFYCTICDDSNLNMESRKSMVRALSPRRWRGTTAWRNKQSPVWSLPVRAAPPPPPRPQARLGLLGFRLKFQVEWVLIVSPQDHGPGLTRTRAPSPSPSSIVSSRIRPLLSERS